MIGNDIVDITEAKKASNWQRPRFLDKLFTSEEQQLIHNSEDAFIMVWQLWSIKEAAYKLYIQNHPSRFYNPKGFECDIKHLKGKVKFKNFSCYVQTKITSDYIISEARLDENKITSEIVIFNSKDAAYQSKFLKSTVLKIISETKKSSLTNLSFNTSEFGIPCVICNSEIITISLTHHGNYGAFAIV